MATTNIQKPIQPALEVISFEDASSYLFGCTTTFYHVYQNTSIIFGKESLHPQNPRKQSIAPKTISKRTSKATLGDTGDEQKG